MDAIRKYFIATQDSLRIHKEVEELGFSFELL
jgi:hypothetical protein